MIGDIRVKYCPICESDTEHEQGCFKCKEINGELFHLNASLSDSLKKVSAGFKDFVLEEHDGLMNGDTPGEYAGTKRGCLSFKKLFAPQVRSLRCSQCQHLIKISRFP